MPGAPAVPTLRRVMLHWHHKLPAVLIAALTVAAALGKAAPFGFFW